MVPQSKFQFLTREVASHPLLYSSLTPEILFVSGRVMVVNWLRMPSYIIMLSISNRVVTCLGQVNIIATKSWASLSLCFHCRIYFLYSACCTCAWIQILFFCGPKLDLHEAV
jgi:hypothetical protein